MGRQHGEYDTETGCMAELEEPPMYRVLLLNDDYTPMDFVVDVLRTVFHKSPAEAERIMLSVHEKGSGLCGIYTFETAETKVSRVRSKAKSAGFPLRCAMEPES